MNDTSKIQEIRDRIQKDLDRVQATYDTEPTDDKDVQNVLGGKILGLESALRTIDNLKETK